MNLTDPDARRTRLPVTMALAGRRFGRCLDRDGHTFPRQTGGNVQDLHRRLALVVLCDNFCYGLAGACERAECDSIIGDDLFLFDHFLRFFGCDDLFLPFGFEARCCALMESKMRRVSITISSFGSISSPIARYSSAWRRLPRRISSMAKMAYSLASSGKKRNASSRMARAGSIFPCSI